MVKPTYLHNNMRELLNGRRRSNEDDYHVNANINSNSFVVVDPQTDAIRLEHEQDNLFARMQRQQEQLKKQQLMQQQHGNLQSLPSQSMAQSPSDQYPPQHPQQPHRPSASHHQPPLRSQRPPRQPATAPPRPSSRASSSKRGVRNSRSSMSQHSGSTTIDASPNNSKVPVYIPSTASRGTSDDEETWISGVESQTTGGGGGASISSKSKHLRNGQVIKRIIEDLNRTDDDESLMTALSIACVEFDHKVTVKHNAELYFGAVGVLAHKLVTVDSRKHDVIRMICAAMEMTMRGGSKYVKEAYLVNSRDIMPPFLELVEKAEHSKIRYADEVILNISKCFHYLSRVPSLQLSLARQPGFLDFLQRVATAPLNVACRNTRTRVLANLASAEENKVLMFFHKGLFSSLLKIAQMDSIDSTREYASIALVQLASSPANQIPMIKSGYVLQIISTMVVSEKVTSIRENVTTVLQTLAFLKSSRKRMVEYNDGMVVEALCHQMQQDESEKARRRAAGTLTNLVSAETAEQLADPKLLNLLRELASNDSNADVQERACLVLTKIASCISPSSPFHDAIITALIVVAHTDVDNNVAAVFRLKARDAKDRYRLARYPGVLDALGRLCVKPKATLEDLDNATRALMHLSNENENRKIMCIESVLDALSMGASCSYNLPDRPPNTTLADTDETDKELLMSEIQNSAVRALARLATEEANRPVMAKHQGLLTAIAKATEKEAKEQQQQREPNASPTNQKKDFLAKPLLLIMLLAL